MTPLLVCHSREPETVTDTPARFAESVMPVAFRTRNPQTQDHAGRVGKVPPNGRASRVPTEGEDPKWTAIDGKTLSNTSHDMFSMLRVARRVRVVAKTVFIANLSIWTVNNKLTLIIFRHATPGFFSRSLCAML